MRAAARVLEEPAQARRGFPEVAPDKPLVAGNDHRHHEGVGKPFSKRGLPVPRFARKQDSVPGLQVVRAQKVAPVLLFDELADRGRDLFGQDEVLKAASRRHLKEQVVGQRRGELTRFGM